VVKLTINNRPTTEVSDLGSYPIPQCKLHKFVNILTPFCNVLNPVPYAQFWSPLHQNAFDGQAVPRPARQARIMVGIGPGHCTTVGHPSLSRRPFCSAKLFVFLVT